MGLLPDCLAQGSRVSVFYASIASHHRLDLDRGCAGKRHGHQHVFAVPPLVFLKLLSLSHPRFPSSTLLPFFFLGSLIKTD